MNPLTPLETAAKSVVTNTINWAYGPMNTFSSRRNKGDKSDPVFAKTPLDTLRRAAYANVFDTLFLQIDDFPFVVPDKTLKKVIGKLAEFVFPKGTTFKIENEALNKLLQSILTDTKFQLKTESIVTEAALMDYCGLRSVYDNDLGRWLLEVKPKEYLIIESAEGNPDEIIAIGMEWPVDRSVGNRKRIYWKKERWTVDEYQAWPEKLETASGKPKFKPEDAISEPNPYKLLPITVVPHFYDANERGIGVVGTEEVLTVKSLIRLHHKRHFGHLKHMNPNPIRKNHNNPGEPLNMGIGNVIDLQQTDEKMPVDLTLLESQGMPESVKGEFYDHVKSLYDAAGMKAPPPDDVLKPGVEQSGVALRMLDKDDAKTIETLRDNGYSQVLRHFEKILAMGKNLGLPDYGAVNTGDPASYAVTAKFPDFFPPTDDEIGIKIDNMEKANLPPAVMGPMVAALFGLEDPAVIAQIVQAIEDKRAALEPVPLQMGA